MARTYRQTNYGRGDDPKNKRGGLPFIRNSGLCSDYDCILDWHAVPIDEESYEPERRPKNRYSEGKKGHLNTEESKGIKKLIEEEKDRIDRALAKGRNPFRPEKKFKHSIHG